MPDSRIASWKPRLDITVTTTASPASWLRPLELRREHGEDLVAVEGLAVAVDRQAAVRVAVEGEAGVGRVLETAAASVSRCVEPTPALMLSPSGAAPIAMTSAPGPAQRARADAVGGAVRAVHHHPQPVQRRLPAGEHGRVASR